MKNQIHEFLDSLISMAIIFLAAIIPLIFSNLTTDFFDIPKLISLVVVLTILLGLWISSWLIRGKVEIVRTPLDVPFLLLFFVILVSTYFSASRYSSIYGVLPDVHGSAVSWIAYIFLYFVAASHLRSEGLVKLLLRTLIITGSIIAVVSVLAFFQIFLPFDLAKGINFTPAGSTFSAISFLLIVLPFPLLAIVGGNKLLPQALAVVIAVLFSITIVLLGSIPLYFVLLLVFVVSLFAAKSHLNNQSLILLLIPLTLSLLISVLLYVSFPGNHLYEIKNNFPKEIQLPFGTSWKISVSAFRDKPFVGTGPGTYLYNFTSYKPVEFNQLKFWNFTFGFAHNEFLQFLATLGGLGLFSLTTVIGIVLFYSKKYLISDISEHQYTEHGLLPGLAISAVVSTVIIAVHASTLVSAVITLLIYAALMASRKQTRDKISEYAIKIKIPGINSRVEIASLISLILFFGALIFIAPRTYSAVLADYYHRKALSLANKDGTKTYEYLQRAESYNPYIDLYRIDMAQTNFALANSLASQKGPTKENPKGTLTDQDKQTIQTLVTQAINEGRASVVLSPRSSRNWNVLGLIYRNITGVAKNSLTFSLDAYGRSIQMDPYNPTLRVDVGTIYYLTKNYDLAVRFYSDSVNLKPDYINGYYNLSLALRDKGDLQNAKLIAEQTITLLKKDIGSNDYKFAPSQLKETKIKDYNTVTMLLNQIKSDLEKNNQPGKEAPAESTALQNPNLPSINVPSLNNPPETTNPPVVNTNPEAILPKISPSIAPKPTQ